MNGPDRDMAANGLSEGLAALANTAAPASTVDVNQARRVGRSRLLRRRFAVLGTVTAVAVGAATLATALPGGGSTVTVAPATSPSASPSLTPSPTSTGAVRLPARPSGIPSSSQTTASFEGRDPLTAELAFGWLPDSATPVEYSLQFDGMSVRAGGRTSEDAPSFRAKLFPAGVTPELGTFPQGAKMVRVDAPPVRGREAYWVSSDDPAYREATNTLRWRTPDGRWAELDSQNLKGADRQSVPLRVAGGVVVLPQQIPLPFKVNRLPEGAKVSGAQYETGKDPSNWTASVSFSTSDAYFSLTVQPVAAPTNQQNCTTANGLRACVSLGKPSVLDPVGGAEAWLKQLTLLGTDESRWTTEVLG